MASLDWGTSTRIIMAQLTRSAIALQGSLDLRGLPLPQLDPHEAISTACQAVVPGELDDREIIKSGSPRGSAEKDQAKPGTSPCGPSTGLDHLLPPRALNYERLPAHHQAAISTMRPPSTGP